MEKQLSHVSDEVTRSQPTVGEYSEAARWLVPDGVQWIFSTGTVVRMKLYSSGTTNLAALTEIMFAYKEPGDTLPKELWRGYYSPWYNLTAAEQMDQDNQARITIHMSGGGRVLPQDATLILLVKVPSGGTQMESWSASTNSEIYFNIEEFVV